MAFSFSLKILRFFPDNALNWGRNKAAPRGDVEAAITRAIAYRQHEGRPVFHWWGGWNTGGIGYATSGATVFRFARHNALEGGGRHFRMDSHVLPPSNPADSTTQGIVFTGHSNPVGTPGSGTSYGQELAVASGLTDNNDDNITATVVEQTIGFDNVRPVAGCVYEDQIKDILPADTVTDTALSTARDILATQTGNYSTLDRLRDRINHVHQNRTTQIGWACPEPTYLEFSTSPQAYRYFLEQTVGTGGTAPSATGPAMTLPNRYAGYGISTQVRVYVYVYAAMSGATDSGTIAVANKNAAGTMGTMMALTNPQTIGGTGYAWYPSLGALSTTAGAYFLSPTVPAFDRICLGGRSEGATDKLRIKAWMMIAYPVVD